MATGFVNPTPFLGELTGSAVVVRLKWGQEYKGMLKSTDKHMNLQLLDAEEWIDGAMAGSLGEILIRCVHTLWQVFAFSFLFVLRPLLSLKM